MSADYVCQILWAQVYVLKTSNLVKVGAFAWYNINIFDVRFERRKVDTKKQNLYKHWNMQTLF